MRQVQQILSVQPNRKGLFAIGESVANFVRTSGIADGLLTVFCRHTSASLLIQENAAPAARRDLERFFDRIAPEGADYEHADEGPDDMPAHLRGALTQVHLSIPVVGGMMVTRTWQGIYLFEHRHEPPLREIVLHLIGE